MEKIRISASEPIFGFSIGVIDLIVHDRSQCAGTACCVHNPSDHPMRDFPLHWRADRGIMERTCSHDVGHPDPDDLKVKAGVDNHGCDGCCVPLS